MGESVCNDCVDDDGNGLVDAADPACAAGTLTMRQGTISSSRIALNGTLGLPHTPAGPVVLLLTDAAGTVACSNLGSLHPRGHRFVASGHVGGGVVSVVLQPRGGGTVAVRGRRLGLRQLDGSSVTLGLDVGGQSFAGTAAFAARSHGRWTHR